MDCFSDDRLILFRFCSGHGDDALFVNHRGAHFSHTRYYAGSACLSYLERRAILGSSVF
jgi:hypothetical protein